MIRFAKDGDSSADSPNAMNSPWIFPDAPMISWIFIDFPHEIFIQFGVSTMSGQSPNENMSFEI